MDIQIFKDGKKRINKKDVNRDADIIVIPASVKTVSKGAFKGVGNGPESFLYTGTKKQLHKINFYGEIPAACVYCSDGLEIFAL